ncbi:hypothetical protein [Brenneria corticis]|uniref:Histidine-specific methyltransferase SAM-dependent domain-containing protein n=1 Tax=Brenneria corticis TaxID=2173106 RepID=A0A2U1TN05_9GAMM|nr:hypothetical protein [Brenneria sp. CFCC 11842]PWC10793.1 hypothetical protein DDT56_21145 [Brenneria sp. CFCC 11842]
MIKKTESFHKLESAVCASLSQMSLVPIGRIDSVPNTSKYAPKCGRDDDISALKNIFFYMAKLNEITVKSQSLCKGKVSSGFSLRDNLVAIANYIFNYSKKRSIRYVELGPEPHKSTFILQTLQNLGADISSYVGIDINPQSENTMRLSLSSVIPENKFLYVIHDYKTFDIENIGHHNGLTIFTMMGFEEGNELPDTISDILSNLMQPGDILLSEMQILSTSGFSPFIEFYELSEMKKFSREICKRFNFVSTDDHAIFIIPVKTCIGNVMTAATIIPYKKNRTFRYLLTNCCLKYTLEQFRQVRLYCGRFRILDEFISGDRTVVYQLSVRL